MVIRVLSVSENLTVPRQPPRLTRISNMRKGTRQFPRLKFIATMRVIIPPIRMRRHRPIPTRHRPLAPPSHSRKRLQKIPTRRYNSSVTFIVVTRVSHHLLMTIRCTIKLPIIRNKTHNRLSVRQVNRSFGMLTSQRPAKQLYPTLSRHRHGVRRVIQPYQGTSARTDRK